MKAAKKLLRGLLELAVTLFGSHLIDQRTGRRIARALVVSWRGKIYLFGYRGDDQVMPLFLPQVKMSFWKREIGFATHPPPDFPGRSGTEPPP